MVVRSIKYRDRCREYSDCQQTFDFQLGFELCIRLIPHG